MACEECLVNGGAAVLVRCIRVQARAQQGIRYASVNAFGYPTQLRCCFLRGLLCARLGGEYGALRGNAVESEGESTGTSSCDWADSTLAVAGLTVHIR